MKSLYNSPEIEITTFSPEEIMSTSIAVTDGLLDDITGEIDFNEIK